MPKSPLIWEVLESPSSNVLSRLLTYPFPLPVAPSHAPQARGCKALKPVGLWLWPPTRRPPPPPPTVVPLPLISPRSMHGTHLWLRRLGHLASCPTRRAGESPYTRNYTHLLPTLRQTWHYVKFVVLLPAPLLFACLAYLSSAGCCALLFIFMLCHLVFSLPQAALHCSSDWYIQLFFFFIMYTFFHLQLNDP